MLRKACLFAILSILVFAGASYGEVILEHSFDASSSFNSTSITSYEVPGPGRFRLTLINPDASADGWLVIEFFDPAPRIQLDGVHFGYPDDYRGSVVSGLAQLVAEFSVDDEFLGWGVLDVQMQYTANGNENTGTNTVRVEYLPEPIVPSGPVELSFTSAASDRDVCSGAVPISLPAPGWLLVRNTAVGTLGGGHEVIIDGSIIGYTNHAGAPTPEFSVFEIAEGAHQLELCHDDVNASGSGTRTAEITTQTRVDVPTMSSWGLVVTTLLILAAGTLVYSRRVPRMGQVVD